MLCPVFGHFPLFYFVSPFFRGQIRFSFFLSGPRLLGLLSMEAICLFCQIIRLIVLIRLISKCRLVIG